MTALRIVFRAACFAGGWLAMCLVAGLVLPPLRPPVLREKYAHLAAHTSDFDTVFIGSSRVYHGIDPKVFDAETKAAGHPTRSFNFALDASWPPESFHWVREFLRLRSHARWVFIELLPLHSTLTPENTRTVRSISWHDWYHTVLSWRTVAHDGTLSSREKADWFALHGEMFLRRLAGLSRGSDWFAPRLRPELEKAARKEFAMNTPWLGHQGFLAEPPVPMPPDKAAAYRDTVTVYGQHLAPVPISADLRDELRVLVATVRAAGAVPIFFITPSTNLPEHYLDLRAQGVDADLISFKDPAQFPALYDPALHFDSSHLSEAGAGELSRLLARSALPLLGPASR